MRVDEFGTSLPERYTDYTLMLKQMLSHEKRMGGNGENMLYCFALSSLWSLFKYANMNAKFILLLFSTRSKWSCRRERLFPLNFVDHVKCHFEMLLFHIETYNKRIVKSDVHIAPLRGNA